MIFSGHHQQKQANKKKHAKSKADNTKKSTHNLQFPPDSLTLHTFPVFFGIYFSSQTLFNKNTYPRNTRTAEPCFFREGVFVGEKFLTFGHQSQGMDGRAEGISGIAAAFGPIFSSSAERRNGVKPSCRVL